MVAAEGRKISCADHDWNDLVFKISKDNGKTWGNTTLMYSESNPSAHVMIHNPSPVVLKNGTIIMIACRNTKAVLMLSSHDNAQTWSKATYLSEAMLSNWNFVATGPP